MRTKVAIISDIQGNYAALQQVFKHLETESIEQVICLGDVASGAQPRDVLKLLRDKQVRVVKGNMDDTILNPQRHESEDADVQRFDDIDFWCSQQLSSLDKAYIRSFRPTIQFALADDIQVFCFHGSPYSYNTVIDETLSDDELAIILDGYAEDVMATGHMHHPFLRHFRNSLILNPGSVGLPRKRNHKHPLIAEYAIIEVNDGQIHVNFRKVDVDVEEFKRGILESGMPHLEWFLSQWDV